MKPLRFASGVKEEIRAAARWYESRRVDLGVEFLLSVDEAIDRLAESPEAQSPIVDLPENLPARQASVRRFPYRVAFPEQDAEILVLACAHTRQRPGYWLKRVEARQEE
ncbi:MAG: type II toxin-antitoxin system RelE/ParE family toxin [Planctomycetes bacterium]|nr:type II toxin-antitoxin system RelE/ParE family toxin [Planctomycetota bacterium]